jgi:alpha-amylase
VQNCELVDLSDLDTGSEYVRGRIAAYLNDLLSLGVDGFRIDGAKHIAAEDLDAILEAAGGDPLVFFEVIDYGGEAVSGSEYTGMGRITEFRFSAEIARVFREGQLAWLEQFGEVWGMQPGGDAVVFVDNHDNQRGHGSPDNAITFADGRLHELANIFTLAWPYGYPRLMSSYEFEHGDQGPPAIAPLDSGGACNDGWVCEHRRASALAMVELRNTAGDAPVSRWWSNGNDQIAFAREGRAFVAINREELGQVSEVLDTGLPAGRYCDVLTGAAIDGACSGREVSVAADGFATIEIGSLDALAIHARERL